MKTFYFNTGVRPFGHNPPRKLGKGEIVKGGTVQIPFDCEGVPENSTFKFACDNPNLPEAKYHHVAEIHNSALVSKFAYFLPPLQK